VILWEALRTPGRRTDRPYHGWVRWDDRKAPESPARPASGQHWMTPQIQDQLDALEARLAVELRAGPNERVG